MSIYDNETTSKIYPDLNPTAPQEPQTYRLQKLTEIENGTYLLDEIEVRERIAKKMKRFNTITGIVNMGLIISTVITGEIFIAGFVSGVGLPVGIALSGTSLLFSLATVITRKSSKTFTVKQEKHNAIKLLAKSKLKSIVNIISQAHCRTEISHPLNFAKYFKRWKNIANLRLILQTRPRPR